MTVSAAEAVAPEGVGAALPLRETEGDAVPLIDRESAPLKDALPEGDVDADGLGDVAIVTVSTAEAVAPEGVGAALPLRETEGDAVPLMDRESAPLKDALPEGD